MKAEVYEISPTCDNPLGYKPPAPRVPLPFETSSGDAFLISEYAQRLRELQASYEPGRIIDSSHAAEQYRELSAWNREQHNELVVALQDAYAGLADRIAAVALNNQHQLEEVCRHIPLIEVPYAVASLPPNLFDHRGGEPFLPSADEEIIQLVSEYMLFNRRLSSYGGNSKDYNHPFMNSMISKGFDVVLELQRRRDSNDQTFATESGRQNWKRYNQEFYRELHESPAGSALSRNATYIAYRNNHRFSEEGGFFEVVDDRFESFWLADFESQSAFTAQIRTPVGWYGSQPAKELALATSIMMDLAVKDKQFEQDAKRIAHDPKTRLLCQQHLLRSRDRLSRGMDPVEHGIKYTALEGIESINAMQSGMIEADGIPGYETRLWEGLAATLKQQTATQVTSHMPAGVTAAQGIWGYRIPQPMTSNRGRMRVRPEADDKLQVIRERRIALQHAEWSAYRESEMDTPPPVRFSLYCPFKGPVVKKMTETLMICRAIAHGSSSSQEASLRLLTV